MNTPSSKFWIDLYRNNPIKAWDTFLQRHDRLIMAVIRKFTDDHDTSMDLYTYTLEHLKKDQQKRLTSYFSKPHLYPFETWIAVVIRNACFDWFRKEKGRHRLLQCIAELPPVDQWIFRYIHEHGYSYEITYELLKNRHGFTLPLQELSSHVDQINDLLSQKTKWKIHRSRYINLPFLPLESDSDIIGQQNISAQVKSKSPLPEERYIHNESENILKDVINALPSQDQLIIKLHFFQGRTLAEIARILDMKDQWHVRRRLEKTFKSLKKKLQKMNIGPSDLDLL